MSVETEIVCRETSAWVELIGCEVTAGAAKDVDVTADAATGATTEGGVNVADTGAKVIGHPIGKTQLWLRAQKRTLISDPSGTPKHVGGGVATCEGADGAG